MDTSFERRTDARLLSERRRPEDAFAAFYRRHNDAVMRYVASRGLDPHAAADVVSATFFAALRARRRYRPQNPTALPWLLTIATSQIADSARKDRRDDRLQRRIVAHDPPPLTDADTAGYAALVAGEEPFTKALGRLPDDQRSAVQPADRPGRP
ncbi:sigma factor [Patulibacter sp. NPDC049589]|uniref:RNA polymerase sigma factor n=1 Tax=Patulibacter sp. NPDC049589 TaxID=3154731 RepID=UPI003421C530